VGRHVLLGVIGISTAIEYGLKGIYENTIGRLSELEEPPGGTAEDRFAARVAADYVALISKRGWYEFDFAGALAELWKTVPASGPGPFRKWERRFALTAEYGVKTAYAALIGLGTKATYSADETRRGIVVAGWSDSISGSAPAPLAQLKVVAQLDRGYALLTVPRYTPFRDALIALSERSNDVRLAELSGSEIVTISGTAPQNWLAPPRTSVVVAYAVPSEPTRNRILLRASGRDLLDAIHRLRTERKFEIEHIYDY
jgi:hypothetical protein